MNKGFYIKTSIIIVTFFTVFLFTACGGGKTDSDTNNSKSSKTTIPAFPTLPGVDTPPKNEY